ncbi:UNVERIFIED_ORG: LysR family pca operon transcriptional activator [Xanthobacter viscosus]|jgi:LysR family pca operon transcriptional activator|uniref:Pca operon transcription factor PcaQ n=1 Tax=Xanthobacter autotrophicus TaxID=280 RepID=A0A6C1KGL5_XANAU|nr:pca operon transcription factor PcaQ [Xanthobacter autotrophicus]TLX43429.1 pca operon transcription factor PcaQ [Xanthobacter autotrophicus]
MIDARIKLRHIACFLEVAARSGFGRAAEALHLTQPAVSRAIAELEDILGVPLFERGRGGAVLTGEGVAFRAHAGAAFAELGRGIDTLRQVGGGVGALVVGVLPTVAARIMPKAVQRAKAAGLAASIVIEAGPNGWLIDQLKQGGLDLVVGRLAEPQVMMGLAFEHLYSEPIVFVVRPGHPAATGRPVRLEDIAHHTLIMPARGSIIRPEIDRLFIQEGIGRIDDRIEAVEPQFSRAYVRASDAVWIISHGVVAGDLDEGTLVRLPLSTSVSGGPVGLTTRAGHAPTSAAEQLVRAVREVARGL